MVQTAKTKLSVTQGRYFVSISKHLIEDTGCKFEVGNQFEVSFNDDSIILTKIDDDIKTN